MLDLPRPFLFSGNGGGFIEGNTIEAIICILNAARDRVLRRSGHDSMTKLVIHGSDQTNCSIQKADRNTGINPRTRLLGLKDDEVDLVGFVPRLTSEGNPFGHQCGANPAVLMHHSWDNFDCGGPPAGTSVQSRR